MLSNTSSTSTNATSEPSSTLLRAITEEQISIAIQALDKKIASIKAYLIEVQTLLEVHLNKVQNNCNAYQREITGILNKILAPVAAVSLIDSVRSIEIREGLEVCFKISWKAILFLAIK